MSVADSHHVYRRRFLIGILVVSWGVFAGFLLSFAFEQDLPLVVRSLFFLVDSAAVLLALRAFLLGISVSVDGVVVRRLLRTSFVPWSEVAGFETRLASALNGAEYIAVRRRNGDLLVSPALSVAPGRAGPWLSALNEERARWGGLP